jgi:hypothetical protein
VCFDCTSPNSGPNSAVICTAKDDPEQTSRNEGCHLKVCQQLWLSVPSITAVQKHGRVQSRIACHEEVTAAESYVAIIGKSDSASDFLCNRQPIDIMALTI